MNNILEYIDSNRSRFIDELKEFLSIPSISTSPESKADVEKCAQFLKSHLEQIGMENVKVYPTEGHSVVYADWLHADGKPIILIYGHYDVQPVDPLELWTTPPFEPDIRNGQIYARGAVDDKGQVFIHVKALESHLKNSPPPFPLPKGGGGSLPINVKMIIEGEEEIGSMHLEDFIRKHKELLKSDVVVVSDTAMFAKNVPAITYGLRGLCYMQVEVTGPNRDLHSGSYGGAVDNPINALAVMISKLKNNKGKILIDGFYDEVVPVSKRERAELKKLPLNDAKFRKSVDVKELIGEAGFSTIEKLWVRPTLDCNGIWGGFTGEGAKTVLPSKAYAKISMRLVPDQDPKKIEKLFTKYVQKIAPKSVKVRVTGLHHGNPAITPIDNKFIKAAYKSLKDAFGSDPLFIREGGSIPVVNTFEEVLGIPTVLLGFGLPGENTHSPDEHFDLGNFHKGIITVSHFYNEVGKLTK